MFPYTQNVGTLIAVIKAIGSHGVPDKFTTKELPVWGYKSSNDRPVIGVLKHIGFIDGSGVPQQLWKDARTNPQLATARGTKNGYAELFKTFPDANRKDAEALTNFFKAKTTVGDAVVKQMVSTFRSLAQFGDFESLDDNQVNEIEDQSNGAQQNARSIVSRQISGVGGMTINLNVELTLPTAATGEVYDKFFAAMKKHLIDASK
ncbi:DUF5343 domain-containing protein [Sphingomonas sp. UNC305MFCol5.2]|uniref:DUF5343 domain-containing protein n=1 Tax=Sphingomonas sp. UNC305MFCol5.2 TaxID=1449076 RepID=UPI00046EE585|nr:DUF5343 domain-containing protein [Sphingomonas sp. UNC305MFCol5.2]